MDGVLTDGTLSITEDGAEIKHFNVRDWTGIAYLVRAGIPTVLVSGRKSQAVVHRATESGVTEVHQGVKDKAPVIREIIRRHGLTAEEVAYVGDDLMDIPAAREVGFSVAVGDAHEELKARCVHVTRAGGGRGAIRELAEAILKAQDRWKDIMKRYLDSEGAAR